MILLLLLACASPAPVAPDLPQEATAPMPEVMQHVRALNNRSPAAIADRAARWLLEHPAEAHPVLLEVLAERGPEARRILEILPKFGREEAVDAILAVLMTNDELLAFPAARSLASHPSARVTAALSRALAGDLHTRKAAVEGVALRGDPSTCESVAALLRDDDAGVRERAGRAVHRLGCLTPERLDALGQDPSEDVRALASELRGG